MTEYFGREMKKLGFGLMRLPKRENGSIDVEQTSKMVDMFMAAGMTYFDTAFVYQGSEDAIREALVKRYPRESYTLATKLNAWLNSPDEETSKKQIYTSLERTGAQYFDFYLLHAIQDNNYQVYAEQGIWEYAKELKEKGLVKHIGFSFHGSPALLETLLQEHPEVEFVQLQINYADWENPAVTSHANYDICRKYNKPIVVMEPVKGGTLANPPQAVQDLLKAADPEMSIASWAIRYVASLDGIMSVLSGMSNIAQMEDNLSYMKDFKPLSEDEQKLLLKVQETLNAIRQVPCTGCRYCVKGCPMGIQIPDIFTALNMHLIYGQTEQAKGRYNGTVTRSGAKASDCIHCMQCEGACPQRIEVTKWLEEAAEVFE
ncbi:MAG: aldo/keto reductase [Solobacterium sp.]|nr:aldo/keto reductase [Solobacterium sp.]